MQDSFRQAIELAKFVLKWHKVYGADLSKDFPLEFREHYLQTLNQLRYLDPNSVQTAFQVARAQVSGNFECFFTVEIPDWFFRIEVGELETASKLFSSEDINRRSSCSLGRIGRLIDELLTNFTEENYSSSNFKLPIDWQSASTYLQPEKTKLHFASSEEKLDLLRHYFNDFQSLQEVGLGGAELMVSMNADISEQDTNSIFAYSPACFNFQLSVDKGTIVSLVANKEIEIVDVTLGCPDNYGALLEGNDGN